MMSTVTYWRQAFDACREMLEMYVTWDLDPRSSEAIQTFVFEMKWSNDQHSSVDPALSSVFKRAWGDLLADHSASEALRACAIFLNKELVSLRNLSDRRFVDDCLIAVDDPLKSSILYPLWLTAVGRQSGDARNDPS